jgi:hypothetical protein
MYSPNTVRNFSDGALVTRTLGLKLTPPLMEYE